MTRLDFIGALAAALAKAQGEIEVASRFEGLRWKWRRDNDLSEQALNKQDEQMALLRTSQALNEALLAQKQQEAQALEAWRAEERMSRQSAAAREAVAQGPLAIWGLPVSARCVCGLSHERRGDRARKDSCASDSLPSRAGRRGDAVAAVDSAAGEEMTACRRPNA